MKGQSSIEFMSLVSISMVLLAVLTTVMVAKQQDTIDYRAGQNSESIGEKVSFQIEMALVQGEGYSRIFTLPGSIQGSNYTVTVGEGATEVFWRDDSFYQLSRYRGDELSISVNQSNRVFRVKHNSSGVHLVES